MNQKLLSVAKGETPADLVIQNGKVVNVYSGEIYDGGVAICGDTIAAVGDVEYCIGEGTRVVDAEGKYLTPGFLDGHIHPESSSLAIRPFAEAVLAHGTTGIMTDLHEVGVVSGLEGIEAILKEAEATDLKIYFVVPSHVPFSPNLETSGGRFNPEIIRKALKRPDAVGLSECVGPYITAGFPDLLESFDTTLSMPGKTLQGHLPDMYGPAMSACIAAGVSTDHESFCEKDVFERLRNGCHLMMREGSAARNMPVLLKTVMENHLDTAMGSNFILGGLVNSGTVSFGWAMALLLCSGILFILVTVLGVRKMVVDLLPKNLKIAIPTAVGFFIAYLGFKNTGLAAFSDSGLALGDFTQPAVLLALITMAVMGVLTAYKVRGAILIGIIVGTVISIPMGVSTLPTTLVSLPDMSEIGNLVLCYDFKSVLADIPGALVWIFILFTSDFFATFGALIAVGAQTNMLDEDGNFPQIEKPFLVDAVGTVVGSGTGCTTISTFIESTIGVEAGGRTGLTAIVSGGLFLVCIFLSPLFLMIPTAVTGVALIFVGFSMLSGFTKLDFSDFKSCFGPFVMILFGTFTGDIAAAICLGVLTDVLIKVLTGDAKKVHPVLYVLCIPLVLYFIV